MYYVTNTPRASYKVGIRIDQFFKVSKAAGLLNLTGIVFTSNLLQSCTIYICQISMYSLREYN